MINSEDIKLFSLANESGAEVVLSNLGAGIVSIVVPDKDGKLADVALGYKNPADYYADGPCMGKVPGRFANRIAGGKFTLGGKEYSLAINNGPNHLHGGPDGQTYANRLWNAEELEDGVRFTLESPDGDAGYPGAVKAEALYTWSENNELTLKFTATTDSGTIINLTNHAYFNLKGESAGDVTDHYLKLDASRFLETDDTLIPTGTLLPVKGTPMDFTAAKKIGKELKADYPALNFGKGYDNCYVLDAYADGKVAKVAELYEETSGRKLTVSTDAPGLQVYTGNWLAGCPESKSGKQYNDYDGVALECQMFPDAPNKPEFPSPVLKQGEKFEKTIVFAFSTL